MSHCNDTQTPYYIFIHTMYMWADPTVFKRGVYMYVIFKQECVPITQVPHSHYHFLCSVDREIGVRPKIGIEIRWIIYHKEHVY